MKLEENDALETDKAESADETAEPQSDESQLLEAKLEKETPMDTSEDTADSSAVESLAAVAAAAPPQEITQKLADEKLPTLVAAEPTPAEKSPEEDTNVPVFATNGGVDTNDIARKLAKMEEPTIERNDDTTKTSKSSRDEANDDSTALSTLATAALGAVGQPIKIKAEQVSCTFQLLF